MLDAFSRTVVMCCAAFGLVACAPGEPEERDFIGPGFTNGIFSGEVAETYTVQVRHYQVRNMIKPGKRFAAAVQGYAEDLVDGEARQGFQGVAWRNVGRLRWWSLAVWDSEEDLDAFESEASFQEVEATVLDTTVVYETAVFERFGGDLPPEWDEALWALQNVDL